MPPADAITAAEADEAFALLTEYPVLVLAVSGGPDSVALLHLVAEWRARRNTLGLRVHAATVDHGLRAESPAEAAMVATQASSLNIPHTTLSWLGKKPATSVPVASREARYGLLVEHAVSLAKGDRVAVVTAHHANDQAETLLMRLARGSGADGLAAMQTSRGLTEDARVMLVRPLLAFSKARLGASVSTRNVAFVDDPTNRDTKFERPRVRAAMALLREAGLGTEALATSARRLGDARAALDYATAAFEATLSLDYNHGVFARLDRQAFDLGPAYVRQRVVARLVEYFGGASPSPRLSEVESIVRRLETARAMSATLGGAVIAAADQSIRVWREPGRLATVDVPLPADDAVVWDERFRIARRPGAQFPITIRPLGEAGLKQIADRVVSACLPAQAAVTQPALWRGGTLIAVPTLMPFAGPMPALGADPEAVSACPLCFG